MVTNLLLGDSGVLAVQSLQAVFDTILTLISRNVILNQGYWDGMSYGNVFLGLSPAVVRIICVAAVYAYAFAMLVRTWNSCKRFHRHCRHANWMPWDDVVNRFRGHSWGKFGLIIVTTFAAMVVLVSVLGPTTMERNVLQPYDYEISYRSEDTQSVGTVPVGETNLGSGS